MYYNEEQLQSEKSSYMVTVSDLMAGLLFVFIIAMISLAFKMKESKKRHDEFAAQTSIIKNTRSVILEDIRSRLEKDGIQSKIHPDTGILRFENERNGIPFGSCEAEPIPRHQGRVKKLATALFGASCCFTKARVAGFCDGKCNQGIANNSPQIDTILIEGHTDSVKLGRSCAREFHTNLRLSAARAAAVKNIMEDHVPQLGELKNSEDDKVLSISGYGELRPVEGVESIDKSNRRIDLRFIMEPPKEGIGEKIAKEVEDRYSDK